MMTTEHQEIEDDFEEKVVDNSPVHCMFIKIYLKGEDIPRALLAFV